MDLQCHSNESIGTWGAPRDMHEENYFLLAIQNERVGTIPTAKYTRIANYCISKFLTVEVILPITKQFYLLRVKTQPNVIINHWHNIALHVVDWGHDGPFAVFYNNFNINNNNIQLSPEGEVNSRENVYRVMVGEEFIINFDLQPT